MMQKTDCNSLVLRKYAVDIRDSIYSDFKGIVERWELGDYFVFQQNYILCTVTGSYIRFKGLDDSERIKGISNFQRVVLEEISEFDEDDFKQIRKRLRGRANQQIIGLFNPISEDHWIKKSIFDTETLIEQKSDINGMWVNEKGNLVILKTNYLDNTYIVGPNFVDQHVIDDFEKDKIDDYAYYSVYGLGNWGKLRTGGEFWKDFNQNHHIKPKEVMKWNEEMPLHLTWDKNLNPYPTCLVWQIELLDGGKKRFKQIDEICLEDPRNRLRIVCEEFTQRYPKDRVKGLYIYGDQTAIAEDTTKEKGENFYTDIERYLKDYRPVRRLQSVNPNVNQSGQFINECYRGTQNVEIWISEICKKSIHDYSYALIDENGGIVKSKKKNPKTGVSYEEFGHPSDAKRYFLIMSLVNEYNAYRTGHKGHQLTVGKPSAKAGY